jgi:hypothetical protein
MYRSVSKVSGVYPADGTSISVAWHRSNDVVNDAILGITDLVDAGGRDCLAAAPLERVDATIRLTRSNMIDDDNGLQIRVYKEYLTDFGAQIDSVPVRIRGFGVSYSWICYDTKANCSPDYVQITTTYRVGLEN